MKNLLRLLGLSLAIFMLVACGGQKSQEEVNVEGQTSVAQEEKPEQETSEEGLTLEIIVPGYDSGYLQAEMDDAIAKYKDQTGINIEVVSVGWDELNTKIVQLYQAGEAPDMMMVGSRSLRQFAELGVLEDLTPYFTDEYVDSRIETIYDTGKVAGVQYGSPLAFSSRALFYRSDLIDNPPSNWDELYQVASEVAQSNDMYGFAIPTDVTSGSEEILNFVYQAGGRITDNEGNYTLTDDKNVKAFEYLYKFKDLIPDPVGTSRSDQAQLFVNGDLAMFVSGSWEFDTLDEGKYEYGVVALPEGDQKAMTIVTDSYAVSSISDHKQECADFIMWMGELDRQKEITLAYNWYPVSKAEMDLDVYKEEKVQPFMESIPYGVPAPQVPNWDEFGKSFTIAMQRTLTGEATAQEALQQAQEELTK